MSKETVLFPNTRRFVAAGLHKDQGAGMTTMDTKQPRACLHTHKLLRTRPLLPEYKKHSEGSLDVVAGFHRDLEADKDNRLGET